MDFKLHWSLSEAIIATVIATLFIGGLFYVHPGLHPLAYAAGWLILAGILYQTGCEFAERTRSRTHSRADDSP
jgi:hypothetical protein